MRFGEDTAVSACDKYNIQDSCLQVVFFQALKENNSTKSKEKNPNQTNKNHWVLPYNFSTIIKFPGTNHSNLLHYPEVMLAWACVTPWHHPNLTLVSQEAASYQGSRGQSLVSILKESTHTHIWWSTIVSLYLKTRAVEPGQAHITHQKCVLFSVSMQTPVF